MALGSSYNNNEQENRKNKYSPTVYSPYRLNNGESQLDPTCMTFTMCMGNCLKISICPKVDNNPDGRNFDVDKGISIYLNHTKARILSNEIKKFLSDPVTYNSVGVASGKGLLTISNGSEFGVNNPCMVLRSIDENGTCVASTLYDFKTKYHFAIRNYNEATNSFNKEFDSYDNIEVEQLVTLLDSYVEAMTGAVAFSVANQMNFEFSRLNGKIESICGKLGVETGASRGRPGNRNQSYFNSTPGNASSIAPGTLAELDNY